MRDKLKNEAPNRLSNPTSFALIFIILLLPSFINYFQFSTSLALGTLIVGCFAIVKSILFAGKSLAFHARLIKTNSVISVCVGTSIFLAHLAVSGIFQEIDWFRAAASMIPLIGVLISALALSLLFRRSSDSKLHRQLQYIFLTFCTLVIISISGIVIPGSNATAKPIFPFVEPSHFALCFTPLLMYVTITAPPKIRPVLMGIGLAFVMIIQNMTMLAGLIAIAVVIFRIKTLIILSTFASFVVALISPDLGYFTERLDFLNSNNLSALSYVQGWQLISESWTRSHGWGLGFQQLGSISTSVTAADEIYSILGEYLNLQDGGFLLSKILSEFGMVGLITATLFFVKSGQAFSDLRKTKASFESSSTAVIYANC